MTNLELRNEFGNVRTKFENHTDLILASSSCDAATRAAIKQVSELFTKALEETHELICRRLEE